MKKSIFWLMSLLFTVSLVVTSCDENDGVIDPYQNWTTRNRQFIDSIANVAKSNPSEWKIIHTYKYPPQSLLGGDADEYVYCKVIDKGNGETPLFTDTVSVNYRGTLIPLLDGSTVVFDQSYSGILEPETAVPVSFPLGGVIDGWASALQDMKAGDRWMVYIPSELGYGEVKHNDIPANSTLIFDIHLVKVKKLK